jgi:hypothetical protein
VKAVVEIISVAEVKERIVNAYTDIIVSDRKNTKELIGQKGGIGKAVPDISGLTETQLIKVFNEMCVPGDYMDSDCYAFFMESADQPGELLFVVCNQKYKRPKPPEFG